MNEFTFRPNSKEKFPQCSMGSEGGNWAVTRVPRAANFWYFKYQISISYFLDVTLIFVIFFFLKCFRFLSLSSWWRWNCKQADLSWRKWRSLLTWDCQCREHWNEQTHPGTASPDSAPGKPALFVSSCETAPCINWLAISMFPKLQPWPDKAEVSVL